MCGNAVIEMEKELGELFFGGKYVLARNVQDCTINGEAPSVWKAGAMLSTAGDFFTVASVGVGVIDKNQVADPLNKSYVPNWYRWFFIYDQNTGDTQLLGSGGNSLVQKWVIPPLLVIDTVVQDCLSRSSISEFRANGVMSVVIKDISPEGKYSMGGTRADGEYMCGPVGQISGTIPSMSSQYGKSVQQTRENQANGTGAQYYCRKQNNAAPYPVGSGMPQLNRQINVEKGPNKQIVSASMALHSGCLSLLGARGGKKTVYRRYNVTAQRMWTDAYNANIATTYDSQQIIALYDVLSKAGTYATHTSKLIYSSMHPCSSFTMYDVNASSAEIVKSAMMTQTDVAVQWGGQAQELCDKQNRGGTGKQTSAFPISDSDTFSPKQCGWMEFSIGYGDEYDHRENTGISPGLGIIKFPPPSFICAHADMAIKITASFGFGSRGQYSQQGQIQAEGSNVPGLWCPSFYTVGFIDTFLTVSDGIAYIFNYPENQPAFQQLSFAKAVTPITYGEISPTARDLLWDTERAVAVHNVRNYQGLRWLSTRVFYTDMPGEQASNDYSPQMLQPLVGTICLNDVSVEYRDSWGKDVNQFTYAGITQGTTAGSTLEISSKVQGVASLNTGGARLMGAWVYDPTMN
jgi:hypothetical protein